MKKERLRAIEKEMTRVISRVLIEEVKNDKIKGLVSVTDVKMTSDSKFVDVSFSIMPVKDKVLNKDRVLEGLNNIKGFLRKRLSDELSLRHTPEVRVKLDDTIEHAIGITKLLDEIKNK